MVELDLVNTVSVVVDVVEVSDLVKVVSVMWLSPLQLHRVFSREASSAVPISSSALVVGADHLFLILLPLQGGDPTLDRRHQTLH